MPDQPQVLQEALALIQERRASLWPHFLPHQIPMLIFDGRWTWLIGAAPPEKGWTAASCTWAWEGRHPKLTANSDIALSDTLTAAGVWLDSLGQVEAAKLAALLVHEAFHVWQQAHPSPAWEANELAGITYPCQEDLLACRAEEAGQLALALTTSDWKPHAQQALYWRSRQKPHLAAEHLEFERRMETKEGLAEFVETSFLGGLPRLDPAEAVLLSARRWAYRRGAALAHLLARTGQHWQAQVMQGRPLDELLAETLGDLTSPLLSDPACQALAQAAAQAINDNLRQEEAAFKASSGKRLKLSSAAGLAILGFDPLNISLLKAQLFLHRRYIHIQSSELYLEAMDTPVLVTGTDLIKAHQIEVVIEAEAIHEAGKWIIKTPKLQLELPIKKVEATEHGWKAHLD